MITIKNVLEDCYFLPEDGVSARTRLLDTMKMPGDLYISCFGFTLQDAFDILKESDKNGYKQSLLLDYTQASGRYAVNKIKDLILNTKNTSIVLTSAGDKSKRSSSYWHWKGLVKVPIDKRKTPICMDGSTNISINAFYQGNSMKFFNNSLWANTFINQHNENKNWALNNLKQYQPSTLSETDEWIDKFFANLKDNHDFDLLI